MESYICSLTQQKRLSFNVDIFDVLTFDIHLQFVFICNYTHQKRNVLKNGTLSCCTVVRGHVIIRGVSRF